jgi:ABC-type transport system involved in cytochrome c biogenesis permease subunit
LVTDATGPHWLHVRAAPAALAFIAVGAAFSGYAAWVGGPC